MKVQKIQTTQPKYNNTFKSKFVLNQNFIKLWDQTEKNTLLDTLIGTFSKKNVGHKLEIMELIEEIVNGKRLITGFKVFNQRTGHHDVYKADKCSKENGCKDLLTDFLADATVGNIEKLFDIMSQEARMYRRITGQIRSNIPKI